MKNLVFFLEGSSEREMLKGILPKFLPSNINPVYRVFQGKQDLESKLRRRLNGWNKPNSAFVILIDQDQENCKDIKKRIINKCEKYKKSHIIRIACHELESWYLGDLKALGEAFNKPKLLNRYQDKQKYRNPDKIQDPIKELAKITNGEYQKISGTRAIGPHLSIEKNKSNSFKVFIEGIKKLI